MTRDELLKQPPTDEQIETSLRRIATGKVRRCIPVEPDDDDVVLSNAIDHIRERARRAEQAKDEIEIDLDAALTAMSQAGCSAGWPEADCRAELKSIDEEYRRLYVRSNERDRLPPPAATETPEGASHE